MHRGARYWLVGASEGLGRALAYKLSATGVELALSARNEDRLNEMAADLPNTATVHAIDVSDADAVSTAAKEVGKIDGVIYAAGVYWPMAAKDWDLKAVEAMCDINFTGAARVMGATVPAMIERNAGHVVMIGSLSGCRGLPGADRLWRKQSWHDALGREPLRRTAHNRREGTIGEPRFHQNTADG